MKSGLDMINISLTDICTPSTCDCFATTNRFQCNKLIYHQCKHQYRGYKESTSKS